MEMLSSPYGRWSLLPGRKVPGRASQPLTLAKATQLGQVLRVAPATSTWHAAGKAKAQVPLRPTSPATLRGCFGRGLVRPQPQSQDLSQESRRGPPSLMPKLPIVACLPPSRGCCVGRPATSESALGRLQEAPFAEQATRVASPPRQAWAKWARPLG